VKRKRENKKKIRWRRPNKKADNIVYCTFIVSNILLPSSMQSPLCQYIDGIQSFVVDVSKEQHDCLVIFHGIFRRFFFSLSCIRFCMKIMKIILRFHSLSNKCDHVVVWKKFFYSKWENLIRSLTSIFNQTIRTLTRCLLMSV
jgi:hypothetical protein